MSNYDPKNWYWLADDGRIYSSAKSAVIADDDADYQIWYLTARPTTWPRDADGNQTEASVLSVISPPVESVSARQFKLQLLADDLLDQVDAWIATQPKAVQIAYEYSGAFVRSEPMMASGFAAMGFTEKQIDDFFAAAAKL